MKTRLFSLFAIVLVMGVSAFAENAVDIRHRMEQRLPQIDALKAQEVVGETNRGYLDERKSGVADAAKVIADENHDRAAVYAYIADQTGSDAETVGRARAKQIAAASRPGVWVQSESGSWVKK
ncbi:MAG: YdbL family protein [Lacunisphaera sp.]